MTAKYRWQKSFLPSSPSPSLCSPSRNGSARFLHASMALQPPPTLFAIPFLPLLLSDLAPKALSDLCVCVCVCVCIYRHSFPLLLLLFPWHPFHHTNKQEAQRERLKQLLNKRNLRPVRKQRRRRTASTRYYEYKAHQQKTINRK